MGLFNFKKDLIASGLLQGATDRHSHILYGLDDGVRTVESSMSILSYLEANGLKRLWFTPHIMEDCPNTSRKLIDRFNELKSLYKGGIELNLAAEYMLDALFAKRLEADDLLTMENRTLLVENSTWSPSNEWLQMIELACAKGYRVLLAHAERYPFMDEDDIRQLTGIGVKFQMNYASLTGFYGGHVEKRARELLGRGLFACIGSDCHRESVLHDQYSVKLLSKKDIEALRPLFANTNL